MAAKPELGGGTAAAACACADAVRADVCAGLQVILMGVIIFKNIHHTSYLRIYDRGGYRQVILMEDSHVHNVEDNAIQCHAMQEATAPFKVMPFKDMPCRGRHISPLRLCCGSLASSHYPS